MAQARGEGFGGLARRHPTALRAGGIGAVGLAVLAFLLMHTARQAPPRLPPVITMVVVQPPKPPPPPPPLPQPKLITPPKMTTPVAKPLTPNTPPKAAPPKPAAAASVPMGTSIHNNGPADNFNLNGNPGGNGFGGGGGGGGGVWSDNVSAAVQAALQADPQTRGASAGLVVRMWVASDGSVSQVSLDKSSGSAAIDDVIVNRILRHMRLDPPPAGTLMPVLMKLTGEAPL